MGLLDKLWDDTLAGPQPDTGLGRLRKYSTFSFGSNSIKESGGGTPRSNGDENTEEGTRVTRSIMIVKPPGYQVNNGSAPASPAGSTPPVSPFSGGRESFRFRRRSASDTYEKARGDVGAGNPPPPHDV